MKMLIELPDMFKGYDFTNIQNGSLAAKNMLHAIACGKELPDGVKYYKEGDLYNGLRPYMEFNQIDEAMETIKPAFNTIPKDKRLKLELIKEATLLSYDEYQENEFNIPLFDDAWWWLRTPGYDSFRAAIVNFTGYADSYGDLIQYEAGIRPALKLKSTGDFVIGDSAEFNNLPFTIISPEYALCDISIGKSVFRADRDAEDANVYAASDVKKAVDSWFEEYKQQILDAKNTKN